jgi:hypothetical protein
MLGSSYGFDVSGKRYPSTTIPEKIITSNGFGFSIPGSGEIDFLSDSRLNVLGDITILWDGVFTTTSVLNCLCSMSDSNGTVNTPFDVWVGSNLYSFGRANANGWVQWIAFDTVNVGNNRFCFVHKIGDVPKVTTKNITRSMFWNSGTEPPSFSPTATSTPLRIGRRSDGATQLNGAVNLVAIWSRSLDSYEVNSISENPWQIFKHRLARFISIPSTAPVTFKPYWARSRSLIIGSGV